MDMTKENRQAGWFRRWWEKRQLRRKLRMMDEQWYMTGGNCFGLFPPSFYYMHTKEEAQELVSRELDKLREIAAQLEEGL